MQTIRLAFLLAPLFLVACDRSAPTATGTSSAGPPSSPATDPAAGNKVAEQLNALVEDYFESLLVRNPVLATSIGDARYNDRFTNSISPEYRANSLAEEKKYLAALNNIPAQGLRGQDLLTWEIFKRDREMAIEGFRYPAHLIPISQFFSTPNFFAQMGSGTNIQPFKTVQDYDNFLSRIDGFVVWMDQAITNMREGIGQKVVRPRVLMERTLPQLAAHIVDDVEQSIFYRPVKKFPAGFAQADQDRLTSAYRKAIAEKLVPAYRRVRDFIQDEYLSNAQAAAGIDALPGGAAWYAYLVRNTTTTDLTPAQIHEIGLAEVRRIHGEIEKVMKTVNFDGDRKAFFKFVQQDPQFFYSTREQLIDGYETLRERVNAGAARLFALMPKAGYEIRRIEEFREKSAAGASYQRPSADGSRPGIFYVNTYQVDSRPIWSMESLFLHEAVPGHHFQIALQQEVEDLPRFRRFGGNTAYIEGWALYAEGLGKELGVYTDPYQYFGALNAELWRAIRLVVDTGLHYKGWTRQQVLDYMYANAATPEVRAVAEAERYMAIPSQALAYKVGQLRIRGLRKLAEVELGAAFDIKDFHAQILKDGALPLGVLEAKIRRWIENNQAVSPAA